MSIARQIGGSRPLGLSVVLAVLAAVPGGGARGQADPATEVGPATERTVPAASTFLGADDTVPPTTEQPAEVATTSDGTITAILPAEDGLRLRTVDGPSTVSGRRDGPERVVVTMLGQSLSTDLAALFDGTGLDGTGLDGTGLDTAELEELDGSGLLQAVRLEQSTTASGAGLVSLVADTLPGVGFRVTVEDRDVVLSLSREVPPSTVGKEPGDEASPRRVLTAADLEPLPEERLSGEREPGRSQGRETVRTVGRVNLRPEPSLRREPLMVLPDATPLEVEGREGNWLGVRLGGVEGWVDGALVEPDPATGSAGAPSPSRSGNPSPELDLGEPGAWLERLGQALEAPAAGSGGAGDLISGDEWRLRERALREASSRRLETTEADLRASRAEVASLRIDLARARRLLDELRSQLERSDARVAELEATLSALRSDAVAARTERSAARDRERVQRRRAEEAELEIARLDGRLAEVTGELRRERVASELLEVEAEALRRVLEGRVLEGRVLEGRVLEGRVLEGRVLEGRVPEGRSGADPGGRSRSDLSTEPSVAGSVGTPGWQRAVEERVHRWAETWARGPGDEHFSLYAEEGPGFADGETRRRLPAQSDRVDVDVEGLVLEAVPDTASGSPAPDRVRTVFLHGYRSDQARDVVLRHLVWERVEGAWLIVEERAASLLLLVP